MSEATQSPGTVYWITGLSGAGKTTLAGLLAMRLREEGTCIVVLDGDELRSALGASSNHGREDRLKLALCYSRLCQLISEQGVTVIIATISLFREVHEWNRANLRSYKEIFVNVPLAELARRDTKGLYSASRDGKVADVAGIGFEVDFPTAPDVLLTWQEGLSPTGLFEDLVRGLNGRSC